MKLIGRIRGLIVAILLALIAPSALADQVGGLTIIDYGIPDSLTGKPGNADNGRKLSLTRNKGHCIACHVMPIPEQDFKGEVGPDLSDVASRLTESELRLRIVNPKIVNEDTIMPAFYRTEGLHMVPKKFQGKTMLTAEEVEDIVAYLLTLKGDS